MPEGLAREEPSRVAPLWSERRSSERSGCSWSGYRLVQAVGLQVRSPHASSRLSGASQKPHSVLTLLPSIRAGCAAPSSRPLSHGALSQALSGGGGGASGGASAAAALAATSAAAIAAALWGGTVALCEVHSKARHAAAEGSDGPAGARRPAPGRGHLGPPCPCRRPRTALLIPWPCKPR